MQQDIAVVRVESQIGITISQPKRLNAVGEQTAAEILKQLDEADANRSIRVVLIKGRERAFCTGVGTSEQVAGPDKVYQQWRCHKRSRKINRMFNMPPEDAKQVIAVAEGYPLGGGRMTGLDARLVSGLPLCSSCGENSYVC